MRSWRQLLDREGNLVVKRHDLVRACIEVGWRGDTASLWLALDDAGEGVCSLEDLCVAEARGLAVFRRWCMLSKNLKTGWHKLVYQAEKHRHKRRASTRGLRGVQAAPTLDRSGFVKACETLGCSEHFDPRHVWSLLDWECSGSIGYKDIKFLEQWSPDEWLMEEKSEKEAEAFRTFVIAKYKNHPVKAWRAAIDTDGSGMATWIEFKQAAEKLNFQGNIAQAFLGLDQQGLGFLTLGSIDQKSADALATFRRWCYAVHGGVMLAFKALDDDDSGSLTKKEFVNALKESSFKGNAEEV